MKRAIAMLCSLVAFTAVATGLIDQEVICEVGTVLTGPMVITKTLTSPGLYRVRVVEEVSWSCTDGPYIGCVPCSDVEMDKLVNGTWTIYPLTSQPGTILPTECGEFTLHSLTHTITNVPPGQYRFRSNYGSPTTSSGCDWIITSAWNTFSVP